MLRIVCLILVSASALTSAVADEIRHTTFPSAILGTWAESADQCAAKDPSNLLIQPAKYGDGNGSCAVRWIVETAGSQGTNYAIHSLCTSASDPSKTQVKDIIIRPQGNDLAVMGRSFENMKSYHRCPTQ